jgi:hypothetical protein
VLPQVNGGIGAPGLSAERRLFNIGGLVDVQGFHQAKVGCGKGVRITQCAQANALSQP